MRIHLSIFAVLWCACFVSTQSDAAALKLFYEHDGKSVEVIGVENGKPVSIEKGEHRPIESTDGTWRLEGSIAENVDLVYFSPNYSIWHRAIPDGRKEDERPFIASVTVHHQTK